MTLTLEQVRQTRFHLARRNGYEPVDVDNFVDKVEVTLAQLAEENQTLTQQVEALTAGGEGLPAPSADSGEADDLRRQLAEANAEVERLGRELHDRGEELQGARGELDGVRGELEGARASLAEGDQGDVVARLHGELDEARGELSGRDERIAALSAELDGVRAELTTLRAAQEERTSKVEHISVTAAADAAPAVTKLLQMATEQAERLVTEAEQDATRLTAEAGANAESTVEEASAKAHQALSDARSRADEIEQQARAAADALDGETRAKAEALDTELAERRTELFSALEAERDELRGKVDHLRSFEDRYRQSLTSQLQAQLESLAGDARPDDVPDLLGEPAAASAETSTAETAEGSATPRLDALLDEEQ